VTILDFITKVLGLAGAAEPSLKVVLTAIEAKFPDTKAELDPIIAALNAPLDVAALASVLPPEALNILKLQFDPRPHAGDAI
jgi:hypothetical protein